MLHHLKIASNLETWCVAEAGLELLILLLYMFSKYLGYRHKQPFLSY